MHNFGILMIFWGSLLLFIGFVLVIYIAAPKERLLLLFFGVFFLLSGILLVVTT